ncbi:protein SDA1 homolog [Chenopodium quinoa]|uniref:protein SDA1 homolog n=1 Tax=Chenopodium quinoa TaxID=63459 RepID=UPI000B774760|nr:protein SDA1 homolog [Chenopodium quinoa]
MTTGTASAMTTFNRGWSFQKLRPEMKKDPESYEDELQSLYRDFNYSIEPFEQQIDFGFTSLSDDSTANKELGDRAFFLAQLSSSYPRHLCDFPDLLVYLLHRVATPVSLSPSLRSLRFKLTQSLILLLNRNVIHFTTLLALFMKLQALKDRNLKKLAYSHVVLSIKKHKNNHARNKILQNVVLHMLQSGEEALARRSLVVLCNLHRMNVWSDALVSNAICRACHHPTLRYLLTPTLKQAALSFLLSYQMIEEDDETDASGNEDEGCAQQTRVVLHREQVDKARHKGTTSSKKKKKAKLKREICSMKRQQRLSSEKTGSNHYSPLSDLHDADAFVDELYSYLHRDIIEEFNFLRAHSGVNMMTIIVIARTIGLHRLIKPKFYCFLGKYLMPHEKEITKLLAAAVEVFHVDVPDDDVKPLFLQIVNNFLHNSSSQPEAFAVGLNVVREICLRMPRLMNDDLLQELVLYKKENVKAISLAAHSLLKLFKEVNPSLLAKKHRGRSAANVKPKQYGEASDATDVPGADLLRQGKEYDDQDYDSIKVENDDAEDDDDGSEDAEGDASDEDAEDDAGDEDAEDDDDDVTSFNCLGDSAVNECCAEVESKVGDDDRITAGEEFREDDVDMEDEFSSLIESDGSHVQISGERKRKYADFDQQLDTADSDFRALKKLTVRKSEHMSEADDHFYSNEEFQQIKKLLVRFMLCKFSTNLLATECELRKCSGSKSTTLFPSSDQLSLKPVNPAKLEANIKRKMTKKEKLGSMMAGREDRDEYKSRAAVKQNKKGGSSNRQKDHKKIMPIAAKRGKIARTKQEKKRKQISSGKQFRGKKAWK